MYIYIYVGYIGTMEVEMETTIIGCISNWGFGFRFRVGRFTFWVFRFLQKLVRS